MMMSLMSMFDPSVSSIFSINLLWLTSLFIFVIPFSNFWSFKSPLFFFFCEVLSFLFISLKSKNFFVVTASVFLFVVVFNFIGLFPMSFCLTSHFFFDFCIGSVIWFSSIFFFLKKEPNSFFSHLTPQGSPLGLSFLLVPIEIVSLFIRPIALSLRLMANMIAGHMILALMNESIYSLNLLSLPMSFVCFFFTVFEIGVCVIQAYVFSSLLFLYWKENSIS